MASLALPAATTTIIGGTVAAHARLDVYCEDTARVALFEKPKTAPTDLEPSTTLMSPYLKFGCLGIREFWWKIHEVIERYTKGNKGKKPSTEPENLYGQLEFRDMYAAAESGTQAFDRIRGNHMSRWVKMSSYSSQLLDSSTGNFRINMMSTARSSCRDRGAPSRTKSYLQLG